MSGKKKDSSVALVKKDAGVPEILSALDREIKSLEHITDTVYKTTGRLTGFNDIKTETKVENLIRAFSSVLGKSKMYGDAIAELGLPIAPQFTIDGGTVEDWKHDITLRINIINHKDKLDKLNEYKNKMSKFLSEQDQKAMLMEEMATFLGVKAVPALGE